MSLTADLLAPVLEAVIDTDDGASTAYGLGTEPLGTAPLGGASGARVAPIDVALSDGLSDAELLVVSPLVATLQAE